MHGSHGQAPPRSAQPSSRLPVGLPAFLAPERPLIRGEIVGPGGERGKVTFLLKNAGTVRIRPSSVRVLAIDAKRKPLFEKSFEGWYVLAGGDRLYEVELPADACAKVATVTAIAILDAQTIEASQPVPGGACAR